MAVFAGGNLFAQFQPPFGQSDAIADRGVKFAIVTQGKNRRGRVGGTIVSEKRQAQPVVATVLINLQTENNRRLVHGRAQQGTTGAALKKQAIGSVAQFFQQAIQAGLVQGTIGGRGLVAGHDVIKPRVKFEVAEMSACVDDAARWQQAFTADMFKMRTQFIETHGDGFDGAGVIFADAPEIFLRQRPDFGRRFFTLPKHIVRFFNATRRCRASSQ